jgi:hypothetical protein
MADLKLNSQEFSVPPARLNSYEFSSVERQKLMVKKARPGATIPVVPGRI